MEKNQKKSANILKIYIFFHLQKSGLSLGNSNHSVQEGDGFWNPVLQMQHICGEM